MLFYTLQYLSSKYGFYADDFAGALCQLCEEIGKDIPESRVIITSVIKTE